MAVLRPLEFSGEVGRTRPETVQYRCPDGQVAVASVYRSVNVKSDPELGRSLLETDPEQALNTVSAPDGSEHLVHVPVVYHDPGHSLMVLVLPEALRHRELLERAALLTELAASSEPVPDYAANFETVFGPAGLEALLKRRAEAGIASRKKSDAAVDAGRKDAGLDKRSAGLDKRSAELDERERALEERSKALSRRAAAVEKRSVELARERAQVRDGISSPRAATVADRPNRVAETPQDSVTEPTPRIQASELLDVANSSGDAVSAIRPGGTEVNVSVTDLALAEEAGAAADDQTQRRRRPDPKLHQWLDGTDTVLAAPDSTGVVRFAIAANPAQLGLLRAEHLQLKLQLHRLPGDAVPTLSIGPAGMLDDPKRAGSSWHFAFDLANVGHRRMLETLANEFRFAVDLYSADKRPVGRRMVRADLGDNIGYLLAAADAYIEAIPSGERSAERAQLALADPDYDRLGLRHPERPSFRDDKLKSLGRPSAVLAALSVARRFSKPEREDYLVLTRSYSLSRWRQRRRLVIARALELGLWIGPRLAHLAAQSGQAKSPIHLVSTLLRNFGELVADGGHGLDELSVRDNWTALREEGAKLGVGTRRGEPIHSEAEPAVSGTIGRATDGSSPNAPPASQPQGPAAGLIGKLKDKDARLDAAVELAASADPGTLGPLFEAVGQMTRSEAGRVLGSVPKYGVAAVPHLVEGLGSRKGFIRQGCALALGVVGTDKAVEALAELLATEPTEIWREVARAIGVIGGPAAAAVVAQTREHPQKRERAAWALANIIVGDGARVVESLARGRDALGKELAGRAREMVGQAKSENSAVRAGGSASEVTVNRAFSRRFFEALNSGAPVAGIGAELSAPAMFLDDEDLLPATEIDEDEPEPLDENDLIPT